LQTFRSALPGAVAAARAASATNKQKCDVTAEADEPEVVHVGDHIEKRPAVPGRGHRRIGGRRDALQAFFENAPSSMDMTFVIVLHLAPAHVSHVDEILQRVTSMPVHQVTSTMPIEKNHIYVIAPGKQLEMSDGCVRTGDIGTSDRPILAIDHFSRTLADAHDHRAVGIVLSGSGSDGAAGLSRIKEAGGITLAQARSDAEHGEMPQHAIATRQVDIVLPVAEMPQRLLDLWAKRSASNCEVWRPWKRTMTTGKSPPTTPSGRCPISSCICAYAPVMISASTNGPRSCGVSSGACRSTASAICWATGISCAPLPTRRARCWPIC
jgi:hypothetical protein